MIAGGVEWRDFSAQAIRDSVGVGIAANYLGGYLREIGAAAILLEKHYIDRHYLADFSAFYARSFDAPAPSCQRLHFFKAPQAALKQSLAQAYASVDAREQAEKELQNAYLGFVVVRPLPDARVGRTVLKTYPEEGRRRYEVVRRYWVNIAGLRLWVDGLAYQQQDGGAAVCASTALWSALQRVASVAGDRTPTPVAITEAARSPFPASHGLNDTQMATALSALGYLAEEFAPSENRALFRAKLVAYLESQLPVVLLMTKQSDTAAGVITLGHAVTVTGFRDPTAVVDVPALHPGTAPLRMRSASVDVVYVHDDNLGSHAHYELFDSPEKDEHGYETIKIRRGHSGRKPPDGWTVDEWQVFAALVPKPEKMRMPIEEIFFNVYSYRGLFEKIFRGVPVSYSCLITAGVALKRSLFDQGFSASELADFLQPLALPRHVGIVRVHYEDHVLCEVALDISEVRKGYPLCIVAPGVPTRSVAGVNLGRFAAHVKCPLLTT